MGHLYLKRFTLGAFFLVGAAVAGYIVISSAVDTANEIVAKIQGGEESTNVATMVFLAFWLIGIIDSVRVGRKLEKAQGSAGGKET